MSNKLLLDEPRLVWKKRLEIGEAAEVLEVEPRVVRALLELGILAGEQTEFEVDLGRACIDRISVRGGSMTGYSQDEVHDGLSPREFIPATVKMVFCPLSPEVHKWKRPERAKHIRQWVEDHTCLLIRGPFTTADVVTWLWGRYFREDLYKELYTEARAVLLASGRFEIAAELNAANQRWQQVGGR